MQFESHQTTIKLRRSGIIVVLVEQLEGHDEKENVQFGELSRMVESTSIAGGERDFTGNVAGVFVKREISRVLFCFRFTHHSLTSSFLFTLSVI